MGLRRLKQPVITNSKGEPIVLNAKEKWTADYWQRIVNARFGNALGLEVNITTLTTIVKKITEQKFFHVSPADYFPMKVGEGTWSSNLTTYRSFQAADIFESGIINTGQANDRMSQADAGVDALNIKVNNWAKGIGWSIFDLELAAKSGNWDLVAAKERARKENWDLGIQRVAFLGARGQNGAGGSCLGLLNQAGVTVNTSLITGFISALSTTTLSTLVQNLVQTYRSNCNYTAFPTHFIIPEADYNGLAAQSSPTYPLKSVLQILEEMFQVICKNKNFKILPLAYATVANATGTTFPTGIATGIYTLLKYDEESVRMDIPLDYTNTLANSLDNFMFQNAAYGQFTGVLAYRPLEMLYLGY